MKHTSAIILALCCLILIQLGTFELFDSPHRVVSLFYRTALTLNYILRTLTPEAFYVSAGICVTWVGIPMLFYGHLMDEERGDVWKKK